MADEVTPRVGTALSPMVVDPNNTPVTYADWIVAGSPGPSPGTISVELAALDYAMAVNGQPRAILQTRLRLSIATATNLHRFLGQLLFATAPVEQGGIN